MATRTAEIHIDRSPDDVWKVTGDFGGLTAWAPGIERCDVEGDERTIGLMGMEIVERLVRRDDATRSITYSIVTGPLPVESHEATITVHPDGDGSRVTYDVTVTPDEHADLLHGVYEQSLAALAKHLTA